MPNSEAKHTSERGGFSRRDFVRASAIGTMAAGLASLLPADNAAAESDVPSFDFDLNQFVSVEIAEVRGKEENKYSVVLLKAAGDRYLPINVGTEQSRSIRDGIARALPPRPMTHDFVQSFLDSVGAVPQFVAVWKLEEMTFHAYYVFELSGRRRAVDSRPSDAIALAVRTDTPIYVAKSVMNDVGVTIEDVDDYEPGVWA